MKSYTKYRCRFIVFNSMDEMINHAVEMNNKVNPFLKGKVKKGASGFTGRKIEGGIEELVKVGKGVWEEGIEKYKEMRKELIKRWDTEKNIPAEIRRRRKHKEEGDELDVDKWKEGEEKMWISSERVFMTGPQNVTLVVEASSPGIVHWERANVRGSLCVALADILEERGYTCDILFVDYCKYPYGSGEGEEYMCNSLVLKESGMPIDISSLVNATSTWYFRTIVLQSMDESGAGRIAAVDRGLHQRLKEMDADIWQETCGDWTRKYSIEGVWDIESGIRLGCKILRDIKGIGKIGKME